MSQTESFSFASSLSIVKFKQLVAQLKLSAAQAAYCLRQAFGSEVIVPADCNTIRLEQRVLLSASPLAEMVADVASAPSASQFPAAFSDLRTGNEIVFVDSAVADYEHLITDIAARSPNMMFQMLEADRDGIEQITNFLASRGNVDSIHILSHGGDGNVQLGNSNLSHQTLGDYSEQIVGWRSALSENADILFYGCELAGSDRGETLIESLAVLTGADIAASDDLTGHSEQGGDWELEFTHGDLTTELIVSDHLQQNWMHTLGTVVVDTAEDYGSADARWGDTTSIAALLSNQGSDGLISLREALAAANVPTGGADQILFDIDDGSGNQYYYQDNFIAGSVDNSNVASVGPGGEALITDFDPDHAYSWFSIDLDNSLPELVIDDDIIIDGYSQWGASRNTLSIGSDAVLRIELTNTAADSKRGFNINSGGAGSTISGLAFNRFGAAAILTDPGADGNTFTGNYIGTDVSGTIDLGNQEGIHLRSSDNTVGGPDPGDRNVLSGNNSRGLITFTFGPIESGNIVQNNYIGVDSTGLKAMANGGTAGIQIYNQSGMQIIDNVVAGNTNSGIRFLSTDVFSTVIQGNMIGIGADGTTLIGNGSEGIYITSGITDTVSDTLIGGTGGGQGNTIGGNAGEGIRIHGSAASSIVSMSIVGNFIGTNDGLVNDLGNGRSGILISGLTSGVTIGGVGSGQGNTIANNSLNGVTIASGTSITIRGNRIERNQARGIDLVGGVETNGITDNDPDDVDSGSNGLQNFPVLTSALVDGADVTINATINSTPNTSNIIVDFYWSNTADPTGHGEAEYYIGAVLVNTDSFGSAVISHTFTPTVTVPLGASITATATSPTGSTSEFSMNVISMAAPELVNNQLTLSEGQTVTLNSTNLDANDDDTSDASLIFNVSNVMGGHFALSIDMATAITSFTKGQLDAGGIVFVHNGNEAAPSYDVEVSDGSFSDGPYAAVINFTNVNDDPIISGPIAVTATEDDVAFGVNLLFGATDAEGHTLNVVGLTLTGGNAAGVTDLGNGLYVDPSAYHYLAVGESETISYSYNIEDGNGGSTSQSAVITITGVNDDPTVSGPVIAFADQDDPLFLVDLLTSASDPDTNDTLSVTSLTLISGNAGGITAVGNHLSVDPSFYSYLGPSDSEVIVYSYDVIDGVGGIVSQTATITINGSNQNPVVSGPVVAGATEDDAAFAVDLLSGAFDPDSSDINVSGLTLVSGDASGVTVFGNSLNVDPNAYNYLAVGESAEIQYSYDIVDGNGGSVAQTATISISGVNDDPVFVGPLSIVMPEDSAAQEFELVDLFLDADTSDSLDLTIVGVADGWLDALVDGSGSLWVMPDVDRNGMTAVTVQVTDESGSTSLSTISINVTPVNDTIVVDDQSFEAGFGDSISGLLLGTLADVDGESLTIIVTMPSDSGTLVIDPDGSFVFEPDRGFVGDTSFAFVVDDGVAPTEEVTIGLRVFENVVFLPEELVESVSDDETETVEESTETAIAFSGPLNIVNGTGDVSPSVEFETQRGQQQSEFAAPDVAGPAKFVNAQVEDAMPVTTAARIVPADNVELRTQSFALPFSSNVDLAALTVINEPGMLWEELDQVRNDTSYVTTLDALAVGSVGTVTSSLVVGYVIWALRSGLLMSSIVATMPAWNLLDPLAIIPVADHGGSESGETLEDIVESQRSKILNVDQRNDRKN